LLPFLEWAPLLEGRLAAFELDSGAVMAVGVIPVFDCVGPIDGRLTGAILKMLLVEVRLDPSGWLKVFMEARLPPVFRTTDVNSTLSLSGVLSAMKKFSSSSSSLPPT